MAKKKGKKSDEATDTDSDPKTNTKEDGKPIEGYVEDEDEVELLQVDLGDMVKMKQVLDETITAAVLEHVDEECQWDNFKLLLMFVSCVFAMVAQFAPIPFPESRPVLGICGAAYFILSGVLQFIVTFIDKDTILLTKAVADDDDKQKGRKNADMKKYGLRIRSNLPRFSEWYSVIVEFQLGQKDKDSGSKKSMRVEQSWSVGQFFDKEGYFDEVGLTQEMDKVMKRFESNQFTKESAKSTKND